MGQVERSMGGLVVRPVRIEDAESLWRNCFPQDTLAETYEYLSWCLRQIEKGWMVRLVAQVDDQAIANAQLTLWRDRAEIGSLIVAEEYRRQGSATALVTALMAEARQRGAQRLEIGAQASESGLIALYRRWGFVPDQEIELPHLSGDRRVIYLVKDLAPPDQGESMGDGKGFRVRARGPDLSGQS